MMWEMMSEEEPSQGKWHCESDNGSERSSEEDEVAEWRGRQMLPSAEGL